MKFKSQVFAQASGSTGGLTYAHNKGGMYVRNRGLVKNPNTPQQQAIRVAVKQLTTRWSSVLTSAQRLAWRNYAKNVPILNALGDTRIIPELAMYIRCNVPRIQVGMGIVDDGPTTYALGTFTSPTITYTAGNQINVVFTATDPWNSNNSGALLIYQSRPQSYGKLFFKGPFQVLSPIIGPKTSPQLLAPKFTASPTANTFYRAQATGPDGRLTTDVILNPNSPL